MRILAETGLRSLGADLVVLLFIAANMLWGFRTGIVRRVVMLPGILGALLAATYGGNGIVAIFAHPSLYANAWSFTLIFVGGFLLVELLLALYAEHIDNVMVIIFDRTLGVVVGALVGFLEIAIILMVALAVGQVQATSTNNIPVTHTELSQSIHDGTISNLVAQAEPGLQSILRPVWSIDLAGHLAVGIDNPPSAG